MGQLVEYNTGQPDRKISEERQTGSGLHRWAIISSQRFANMTNEALNDPELQRILLACLDYGNTQGAPQPVICYSWVARCYEARFGGTFHPSRLQQLERLGVLAKDGDTSRGKSRRYYKIIDPIERRNISGGCGSPKLWPTVKSIE